MPYYKFKDENTDKEVVLFMTISEREAFIRDNPNMIQQINGFPGDADSVKLGRTKNSDGWKDLMGQIKRANKGSTIKTNW